MEKGPGVTGGVEVGIGSLFGRNLRHWRRSQQLPIRVVAQACGVTIATVSDWETGKRFPAGYRLDVLARLTQLPVSCLMCEAGTDCPGRCPVRRARRQAA